MIMPQFSIDIRGWWLTGVWFTGCGCCVLLVGACVWLVGCVVAYFWVLSGSFNVL